MLHLSAIYLPIYGMNYQIGLFSRVHPNTHSNTIVVRNGFAWAVRIATFVFVCVSMGIRCIQSLKVTIVSLTHSQFLFIFRPP